MIINFRDMEETVLTEFYGGNKELRAYMHNDGLNKIMRAKLVPGASIGLHTHEAGSEIIYVLEGKGKVLTAIMRMLKPEHVIIALRAIHTAL